MKTRSSAVTLAMLAWAFSCFSQEKEEDLNPNVLIPALGKKEDYAVVVKMVGGDFKTRGITEMRSFLPLKIKKIQARPEGAVLWDAEGQGFPVLRMPPPDVRKIASMKTFRGVLDLLTGTKDEKDEGRELVCYHNVLEAALQLVPAGGNIHLHVAYASNDRVVLVSCTCMYNEGKEDMMDIPFAEDTVSTWMSPQFPLPACR